MFQKGTICELDNRNYVDGSTTVGTRMDSRANFTVSNCGA